MHSATTSAPFSASGFCFTASMPSVSGFTTTVRQVNFGGKMPKRRTMRAPRVKVPKPKKYPRPKTKDLRILYKGLLTVSGGSRSNTLSYALAWYDSAMPYMIQKSLFSAEARKQLEKAVLCRKQAGGTNNPFEKENALRMGLRLYEKAYASLKPPAVDDAYKQLDAVKAKLEERQKKMEEKYGQLFGLLQSAVGNRFKFELADAPNPIQWNHELTTLTYNQEAAKALTNQYREQGFLPVFIEQLDYLVRHAVLEPNQNGGWDYDPAKHVETLNELLQEFVKFARSEGAPNRLVRNGAPKALPVPGSRPTGAVRGPRPGIRGPKVAGLYTQGSAAALVYERLADGKIWKLADLLNGVQHSHPIWLVRRMFRLGKKTGCWEVKLTKESAQLILPQQQAAAAGTVQP